MDTYRGRTRIGEGPTAAFAETGNDGSPLGFQGTGTDSPVEGPRNEERFFAAQNAQFQSQKRERRRMAVDGIERL
jgi:hypothetical protein